MHARALDVLHYTGDKYILAVADRVDLELRAHDVLIYKDDIVGIALQYYLHVFFDVLVGERYYHVLTAEHIRRTQQHGITEVVSRGESFLRRLDGMPLRTRDAELFEQCVESFAILRRVYRVGGRAEYAHAAVVKVLGQLDSRLSAESDDDAVGTLRRYHVVYVLFGKRLEVQPVGGIEVGGNRFGIIVDYRDVIAELFQLPHAVHGRVVELNALPYTYRTRAENYDALAVALALLDILFGFVLVVVGRIEVRRFRLELRGARVDRLEHRAAVHRQLLSA